MPFQIGAVMTAIGLPTIEVGVSTATAAAIDTAAIAATGAGISAYGTYQAGKQEKANAKYNAQMQEQMAAEERQQGRYAVGMQLERGEAFKAKQRAMFSKARVTGPGTPMLVLQDAADKIERDISMTLGGGQTRSNYYLGQAGLTRMQGRSRSRAGVIGAGTSLLRGFSQSAYYYNQLK